MNREMHGSPLHRGDAHACHALLNHASMLANARDDPQPMFDEASHADRKDSLSPRAFAQCELNGDLSSLFQCAWHARSFRNEGMKEGVGVRSTSHGCPDAGA